METKTTPRQLAFRWALLATGAVVVVGVAIGFGSRSSGKTVTSTTAAVGATPTTSTSATQTPGPTTTVVPVAGMPAVLDPLNIYSANTAPLPRIANDPARVYVPNGKSNTVDVIDPNTFKIVDSFATGGDPQHIVPSYDLKTLWVLDNAGDSLIPIDPTTGQPGAPIHVVDPYNLYFTPDGSEAIIVAERFARLDFRDPRTMALHSSLDVTGCDGINHADYSGDGRYLIVTCEFAGKLAKIDMVNRRVVALLTLAPEAGADVTAMTTPNGGHTMSMPQDVRTGPDGHHFYVADMLNGGVHVIDGDRFVEIGFIKTGVGAHGITPSHDGMRLYVSNRGSPMITAPAKGTGSVSVIDVATDRVVATWKVPGGGSPDMGNITADGSQLWLSGRFDGEIYVFDLVHGRLETRIKVGQGPHGLTLWPLSGRYSLGHTGNMR